MGAAAVMEVAVAQAVADSLVKITPTTMSAAVLPGRNTTEVAKVPDAILGIVANAAADLMMVIESSGEELDGAALI